MSRTVFRCWLVCATLLTALALGCAEAPTSPFKLKGIWHEVQPRDTARSVAERYGADVETLTELNDLDTNVGLHSRKEIFVPKTGGKPPGDGRRPPDPTIALQKSGKTGQGRCGAEGRPCFLWPVDGTVIAVFGSKKDKHHDGIDIRAARGTEVRAAADGEVLYNGDKIKGYGNLLIIRHAQGLITVYAHNEKNLVKEGDKIKRGQPIASVGDSGSASLTHLHFEVRQGERPRDPMLYLP